MRTDGKTGTLKFNRKDHGNPSGSVRSNDLSHAQRIGTETLTRLQCTHEPSAPRTGEKVCWAYRKL